MAMITTKKRANGTSVRTNNDVEASTPRTSSNPFTWEASVPTEGGRASIRMPSMRLKNHSESSLSMALQVRSTALARTCFSMNSRPMAMATPTLRTHRVWNPWFGMTRS